MVNQSVKITKLVVDRAAPPARGQHILRDTELKGFGLRVTAQGAKSFILEKRIKGRVTRLTLGRYPGITAEQARKEAQRLTGLIVTGHDPLAERAEAKARGVTLEAVFADFLQVRSSLKPRTVYDYRRLMEVVFADWKNRPVASLTKDQVAGRHREIGETRGEAYANLSLRFLRSLLNFARAQYEDAAGHSILLENPVARLTHTRAWYRIDRRQGIIRPHQLAAWYRAVTLLNGKRPLLNSTPKTPEPPVYVYRDTAIGTSPVYGEFHVLTGKTVKLNTAETVADYLLLLLFTGLRRQEAATLKWEDVDLEGRTLTIPDPKNHEPLTLPLPDFIHGLLVARHAHAVNHYVFPGTGAKGYLVEPRRHIEQVIKVSNVDFTLHDLRRTFITLAESLDVPGYAIKQLVNHKPGRDVTARYIVSDVERLRRPMQLIADALQQHLQGTTTAKVMVLPRQPIQRNESVYLENGVMHGH